MQLNKANEIYKSFNDEEIKNILSKKRLNSYKKEMKTKKSTISKEKKLEKKAKKFITKNENNPQSKNIEKDLDVNLNINKVISEKNSYERNYYSKLKKDLWKKQNKKKGNLSMTISASPIRFPDKKSTTRTITQERNINNNQLDNKKKTKNPGRLFLIYRNDKNKPSTTNTINNTISNTRTIKKFISTNKSSRLSPNRVTPKKTSVFINTTSSNNKKTSLKIKSSVHSSIESVSKQTIDISSRKKIKTRRNSIDKKTRTNLIDSTSIKSNEGENKHEIKIKKDINVTENIINKFFGEDKLKVNKSKEGVKFMTKMFFGKKKLEFLLNLVQTDKKNCCLTGELIDGDLNNFEKIFSQLKEKLK